VDPHGIYEKALQYTLHGHNLEVRDVTKMLVDSIVENEHPKKRKLVDFVKNFEEKELQRRSKWWTDMFFGAISQSEKRFQPQFTELCDSALYHFRKMDDFLSEEESMFSKGPAQSNEFFQVGEFTMPDNTRQYGVFAKKDFTFIADEIFGTETMRDYFKRTMQMTGYLVTKDKLSEEGLNITDLTEATKDPVNGGLDSVIELTQYSKKEGSTTYLVCHGGTLSTLINSATPDKCKAKIEETLEKTTLKVDSRFKEFIERVETAKIFAFAGCIKDVKFDKDNSPELIDSIVVYILPHEKASFVEGGQLFLSYPMHKSVNEQHFIENDPRFLSGQVKRKAADAKSYEMYKVPETTETTR